MSRNVVIAGGTGFLGRALSEELKQRDYTVTLLSRSGKNQRGARDRYWDAQHLDSWVEVLDGAEAVVNLTGSSIARRWDPSVVRDLFDSRLGPTRLLGKAIEGSSEPPKVWVNASGIGIYGSTGEMEVDESSSPSDGLVGGLSRAWEEAQDEASLSSTRRVKLRIGMVLGQGGGAYPTLARLTRFFLGGQVGSGSQYISWIHEKDLCRMVVHAIEHPLSGPFNACSPEPATNADFMATLRRALHRPWAPPAPAFALKLANRLFGAPDPSLLLDGQRAMPKRMIEAGFSFVYPSLDLALRDLAKG